MFKNNNNNKEKEEFETLSVRLKVKQANQLRRFAEQHGTTVSDIMRQAFEIAVEKEKANNPSTVSE